MRRLSSEQWRARRTEYVERLKPFAEDRTTRMAAGLKHPVHDFLFEYFSFRPAQLLRWSPGADVLLEGAAANDVEWNEFAPADGGMFLAASFPEHRRRFLNWAAGYLEGIAERPALFHCFGLHEWAMVYRAPEVRHPATPLRLTRDEIAQVVERDGLHCTHYDAYRFFTLPARPLNRLRLSRQETDVHDQKGCLHVAMDLYKYAYKIAPWCTGELVADAFLLAWEARQVDMRASPYDLSAYGLEPIRIEDRQGREEYVELQRDLSRRSEPVRERLIQEYRALMDGGLTR
jgi:hypothetical protein